LNQRAWRQASPQGGATPRTGHASTIRWPFPAAPKETASQIIGADSGSTHLTVIRSYYMRFAGIVWMTGILTRG
jgi:hypothetical protein